METDTCVSSTFAAFFSTWFLSRVLAGEVLDFFAAATTGEGESEVIT
jgi:hypothetical protein